MSVEGGQGRREESGGRGSQGRPGHWTSREVLRQPLGVERRADSVGLSDPAAMSLANSRDMDGEAGAGSPPMPPPASWR